MIKTIKVIGATDNKLVRALEAFQDAMRAKERPDMSLNMLKLINALHLADAALKQHEVRSSSIT